MHSTRIGREHGIPVLKAPSGVKLRHENQAPQSIFSKARAYRANQVVARFASRVSKQEQIWLAAQRPRVESTASSRCTRELGGDGARAKLAKCSRLTSGASHDRLRESGDDQEQDGRRRC